MRSCFCARRIDLRSVLLISPATLAQGAGEVLEEPVGVGGLEILQLRRADPRVDPFLGLAAVDGHGARIEVSRVEPVGDALLDGVGGGVRMPALISSCSLSSLSLTSALVLPRTVRRRRLPLPS